jgi:hypothetical protein
MRTTQLNVAAKINSKTTVSTGNSQPCRIKGVMSASGPSRHIAPPHVLGRYRGEADIAFVASRRWVYGYTA